MKPIEGAVFNRKYYASLAIGIIDYGVGTDKSGVNKVP
jgi:hypothetical protein